MILFVYEKEIIALFQKHAQTYKMTPSNSEKFGEIRRKLYRGNMTTSFINIVLIGICGLLNKPPWTFIGKNIPEKALYRISARALIFFRYLSSSKNAFNFKRLINRVFFFSETQKST